MPKNTPREKIHISATTIALIKGDEVSGGSCSAKNKGKYSIDSEGYIAGGDYASIAGFPFPDLDPDDKDFAIKLMWNYDYRYKCDAMHSEFMNFQKRRGESVNISTVESWQLQFQNRLYLDPKPLYETKNGLRQINFLRNLYPPVQKNFMTLLVRYIDQKAADATFLYLPSLRRTLRGEAGERSTPIQSSTQAPDDFEGGFAGRSWRGFPPRYSRSGCPLHHFYGN